MKKDKMGKSLKKLSIVIPVYNIEQYIGRCLESCISQNVGLDDYEIICVNDGSTDNSATVIEKYATQYHNIKVIHTSNKGVSSARNTGIKTAQGEYIWFVDGDDWVRSNCLKTLLEITNKQKVDYLMFASQRVYEYTNETLEENGLKIRYTRGGYTKLDKQYSNGIYFYWFRRNLLIKENIYFHEDMKYAEDTLFLAEYRTKCKDVAVCEAIIYFYYQRSDSAMNKIDAVQHHICMYKLAGAYHHLLLAANTEQIYSTMKNAKIRAMQACLSDLCLYCSNKQYVKAFIKKIKNEKLYPFGIDWGNYRIDRRQSIKNDILNWIFGMLSVEIYFWCCWYFFKSFRRRTISQKFDINILQGDENE